MSPTPPPLDDFHPPYRLGAFGCAILGVWRDPPAETGTDSVAGYEPIAWGRGYLGVAFVLRYDRPPPDYPQPYNEVILSYAVKRGLHLAARPFDLVLDDEFYVAAGLQHYHLPKRLDPTLRVERDERRITCTGADVAFEATLGSVVVPGARGVVSMLMRGFTGHVPILGATSPPVLRTIIRVSPDPATTHRAEAPRFSAGGRHLTPIAAFFWRSLAITVGVPAPLTG